MRRTPLVRAGILLVALVAAGPALAAAKDSTDQARADCLSRAAQQFGLASGNCSSMYPTYSGAYSTCMGQASLAYSQAVGACVGTAAKAGVLGYRNGTRLAAAPRP
jgi:hypothetical protein